MYIKYLLIFVIESNLRENFKVEGNNGQCQYPFGTLGRSCFISLCE